MVVQGIVKNAFVVKTQGGPQQAQLLHAFAGNGRDVQVCCGVDALKDFVRDLWYRWSGLNFRCCCFRPVRCLYSACHFGFGLLINEQVIRKQV